MSSSPSSVRIDQLPNAANVAPTDLVVVLYNAIGNTSVANGSPSLRTIAVGNLSSNLVMSNNAPTTSSSNGNPGNFAFDNNYFYVCISGNTWKRATLQSW